MLYCLKLHINILLWFVRVQNQFFIYFFRCGGNPTSSLHFPRFPVAEQHGRGECAPTTAPSLRSRFQKAGLPRTCATKIKLLFTVHFFFNFSKCKVLHSFFLIKGISFFLSKSKASFNTF